MLETGLDLRPAEVTPAEWPLKIHRSEESSWEVHTTFSEVVTDVLKQ